MLSGSGENRALKGRGCTDKVTCFIADCVGLDLLDNYYYFVFDLINIQVISIYSVTTRTYTQKEKINRSSSRKREK